MKCKICDLGKTHPEAFQEIKKSIQKKLKMLPIMRDINQRYDINITPNNVSRHKSHIKKKKKLHVIEIKEKELTKADPKVTTGDKFTNTIAVFPSSIEPKHERFLICYRNNGYMKPEKSYQEAGFGKRSPKKVYELLSRPEIKAALNEMRAIDFIQLKVTGNQVIAGLGKVANYTDYIDQMYDDNGRAITNIKEWPEELRCALNAVEMTEDVLQGNNDEDVVLKRRFKFRFESHLKAKQELRKHFMEVQLFKKGEGKEEIYEKIIEKLLLNQINPIAAGLEMGKHNIPVPDALKIAMQKVDPNVLDKPPIIDSENMSDYSDEELERVVSEGTK